MSDEVFMILKRAGWVRFSLGYGFYPYYSSSRPRSNKVKDNCNRMRRSIGSVRSTNR